MWICDDCGDKYGERRTSISTYHYNYCEWCGEYKPVTEDRDYCYPPTPEQLKENEA